MEVAPAQRSILPFRRARKANLEVIGSAIKFGPRIQEPNGKARLARLLGLGLLQAQLHLGGACSILGMTFCDF